jgi:antibiotic biosynthesis monooxygenase (ABM) superfamily enzyme
MTEPISDRSQSVTQVVERHVKPGSEEAYEELLRGLLGAVSNLPGYLGANVIRPPAGGPGPYRVVLRFSSRDNMERWSTSEERAHWMRCLASVTIGEPNIKTISGLETWFAAHANDAIVPPPRYKMLLMSLLASYPIMTLLTYLSQRFTHGWPLPLRTLLSSSVLLVTMTYLVMPRVTQLFQSWLYPSQRHANADSHSS